MSHLVILAFYCSMISVSQKFGLDLTRGNGTGTSHFISFSTHVSLDFESAKLFLSCKPSQAVTVRLHSTALEARQPGMHGALCLQLLTLS